MATEGNDAVFSVFRLLRLAEDLESNDAAAATLQRSWRYCPAASSASSPPCAKPAALQRWTPC